MDNSKNIRNGVHTDLIWTDETLHQFNNILGNLGDVEKQLIQDQLLQALWLLDP